MHSRPPGRYRVRFCFPSIRDGLSSSKEIGSSGDLSLNYRIVQVGLHLSTITSEGEKRCKYEITLAVGAGNYEEFV